ncbi:twin-arginine translocase TatA/TatE family subunit [Klebsiella michiganensis]|uniref:twin-arginine translocase TatA/TatE family subunit n=1 Tax=Klebsiella michiganensis TaxID=1134687 RepID=UPI001D18C9A9|nr:twin-arginine translocase TatA/TatE family subunit [Klebsiella michiganensis]
MVLLFGTKKLSSLGSDLGASIKGFKKAMSDEEKPEKSSAPDADFAAKTLADKPDDAKKDETKRHDKEQV